ncbi:MAG: hypothetical protein L6R38_004369 [Xanthoria sp. 2 TBL-2021]|nr:MAG: hypothetical protein L6R38_004369 [Xanthoria sp. 2 TBL-2021]
MDFARGFSSPDLHAYRGGHLILVATVFIVLDLLFVTLRELARRRTKANYGWDDYLIIPALVMNLGLCTHGIVMVAVAGVGHHLQAVLMSNPHQIVAWAKCIYALDLIYFAAVALPKLSILNLCLRVFAVSDAARRITHVMMALMVVIWLSYSLASVFECYPFAYRWDRSIPGGHCFDIVLFYRMVNVSNIVTDIAILILPMPYIWKLHATRSRRGGVTICFLAGSVGIIASCIRPIAFSHSNKAFEDWTWQSTYLVSWSIVEPSMYLVAACLPGLWPLFSQIVLKIRLPKPPGHRNLPPVDKATRLRNIRTSYRGFPKVRNKD